jgi:hypothetical protein
MKEHPPESEFWVLSIVIDDSDPAWTERLVIIPSAELRRSILRQGPPEGWKLLRGKAALDFLAAGAGEEWRWRGDHQTRRNAGGPN